MIMLINIALFLLKNSKKNHFLLFQSRKPINFVFTLLSEIRFLKSKLCNKNQYLKLLPPRNSLKIDVGGISSSGIGVI